MTIGLHPALLEDEVLYKHTFVHEFLHAAGLTLHTSQHDELTNKVAPMPKMSESSLLQRLRNSVLGDLKVKSWTCDHCGYTWDRTTVRKPTRCHKCARPLWIDILKVHERDTFGVGWTYSVVGYHSGLLSRRPGFESWYVRHDLTRWFQWITYSNQTI